MIHRSKTSKLLDFYLGHGNLLGIAIPPVAWKLYMAIPNFWVWENLCIQVTVPIRYKSNPNLCPFIRLANVLERILNRWKRTLEKSICSPKFMCLPYFLFFYHRGVLPSCWEIHPKNEARKTHMPSPELHIYVGSSTVMKNIQ